MTEWFYGSRLLLVVGLLAIPLAVLCEVPYEIGARSAGQSATIATIADYLRYPATLCIAAGALKFVGAWFHHDRSV
jgi:hypothetical protein